MSRETIIFQFQTANLFLPLALLLRRTALPPVELIRAINP